MVFNANFNDI